LLSSISEIDYELLDHKTNEENQTVFHYAARSGSHGTLSVLKRLLGEDKFKKKIEEKDCLDRTCLYLAAEFGNLNL